MYGYHFNGIHKVIVDSIKKASQEYQNDYYQNIILSGGITMLEGFPKRIENEIKNLAPHAKEIKIIAQPERNYAAWLGGSILGKHPTFPKQVVTHEEYDDAGAGIVHSKFL